MLLWAVAVATAEEPPAGPPPIALSWAFTLGAQAMPLVGDEASTLLGDAVGSEGVRVVPLVGEVGARGPLSTFAVVRVEEGLFHAGALEASEARVGFVSSKGIGGLWVGRSDLLFSRDRDVEAEDQTFSLRPMLSRLALPLHMSGTGFALALPERITAEGGLAYATATADAPYRWGRLRVHPLGALPDRTDGFSEGLRVQLAGGLVDLQSEALGSERLWAADLTLTAGPLQVSGGAQHEASAGDDPRWSSVVEAGSRVLALPGGDLHLALRGERVVGFDVGDTPRWLGALRLAARDPSGRATLYGEYFLSREPGTGVAPGEDVVGLPGGAERDNDLLTVGLTLRLREDAR